MKLKAEDIDELLRVHCGGITRNEALRMLTETETQNLHKRIEDLESQLRGLKEQVWHAVRQLKHPKPK